MCGIVAILGASGDVSELRKRALFLSSKQRHRGPDWGGICIQQLSGNTVNILCHERLAIVDPANGSQPLYNETKSIALTVNGEIWNHEALRKSLGDRHQFATASDCEPIVHLYEEEGDQFVNKLDGIFAFVIADKEKGTFLAARDPIGVFPLYVGWGRDGSLWFASEMKALSEDCERFEEFPPGSYWSSNTGGPKRWYNPKWWNEEIPNEPLDLVALRTAFERSVVKRLMTDVPYGVLLSGGLDSSLVASIVSRHAKKRVEDGERSEAWWPRVHSFTIGLKGSPDLVAAKEVADFLGTVHHEFTFAVQEGIDALRDVIYHIETYDVTTVRASTPMFLLARKVKAMGVKMVLSGEGSDEIFGGYLYFHKAPSPEKLHVETCHKIKALSKYDCLRANKSTAAWGVEVREPFLDRDFLDIAMSVDPKEKMIRPQEGRIEKYIIRKAFDDKENPYLPASILWRQKEQFSDGVGYSWIDSLKAYAEQEVSDEQLKAAQYRFPYNTPVSKEAYLYRSIFHSHFPQESAAKTVPGGPSIACSTPTAIEWDKAWKAMADPSGRSVLGVHNNANANAPTGSSQQAQQ
jgi:asparagine synthase (glutamine-hydrolysing)